MNKYIPADKLIAEIERRKKQDITFRERNILIDIENAIDSLQQEPPQPCQECVYQDKKDGTCCFPYGGRIITYLSNGGMECNSFCRVEPDANQHQPANMIQWTGQNLREVVSFTGKSPKFDEYFKSWEEFEQYVHAHGDIFKLFFEDGSHYEVPVGAWIVKTPDGYNVPSVARFVHAKQEQPEVDLKKDIDAFFDKWDKNSYGCIFDENGARVTIETIKGIVKRFLNARNVE